MRFPQSVQNIFLKYLGFEKRLRDTIEVFDKFFCAKRKEEFLYLHLKHKPGGVYDTVMNDIKENPPEPFDERDVRAYYLRHDLSIDLDWLANDVHKTLVLDCVALRKYLLLLELKGCEFGKCWGDRYTKSIKKYVRKTYINLRYLENVRLCSPVWMKRIEIVQQGSDKIYDRIKDIARYYIKCRERFDRQLRRVIPRFAHVDCNQVRSRCRDDLERFFSNTPSKPWLPPPEPSPRIEFMPTMGEMLDETQW